MKPRIRLVPEPPRVYLSAQLERRLAGAWLAVLAVAVASVLIAMLVRGAP